MTGKRHFLLILALVCVTLVQAAEPGKRYWHYDFNQPLGPEWEYIQQPDSSKYRMYDGWLELGTSNSSLTDNDHPTFVGRCQDTSLFLLETKMRLPGSVAGDEAGLTVYHMPDVHAEVYVQNLRGDLRVKMRYTLKNLRQVASEVRIGNVKDVWLRIKREGKFYSFFYSTDGNRYHWLERIDASLMIGAVAPSADYRDIRLGMYAWQGGAQFAAGVTWARFDYLDYKEL